MANKHRNKSFVKNDELSFADERRTLRKISILEPTPCPVTTSLEVMLEVTAALDNPNKLDTPFCGYLRQPIYVDVIKGRHGGFKIDGQCALWNNYCSRKITRATNIDLESCPVYQKRFPKAL